MANVVPIHKSGAKNCVENYRPISLTCICCKLMEHVIYSNLIAHLNVEKFLIRDQHGFRTGASCNTVLVDVFHFLAGAIDARDEVDCLFLDFRKAFDLVDHDLLFYKLSLLSLDSNVLAWIKDYLSGRGQCVVLGGEKSEYVKVESGVPQGSVLGPLLFLIYINDIISGMQSYIRLFADDCVIYRLINDFNDINTLQSDLDKISVWCKNWRMNLNVKKCVHVKFTKKKNPTTSVYMINNEIIKPSSNVKYLGVMLSSDLTWTGHVEMIALRAIRMLNFVRRNFRQAPRKIRETLYFTYIRPCMEYASVVWDPHQNYLIDKLEKVQNQCARFVLNYYELGASVTNMKDALHWEKLSERRKLFRMKFLDDIYNNRLLINRDVFLHEPFYVSERADHPKKIRPYSCRTDTFAFSFFPKTIEEWNRLPKDVLAANLVF